MHKTGSVPQIPNAVNMKLSPIDTQSGAGGEKCSAGYVMTCFEDVMFRTVDPRSITSTGFYFTSQALDFKKNTKNIVRD